MIWNPWKRIRELEELLELAEYRVSQTDKRVSDAERAAFRRAQEHFKMQTAAMEAQLRIMGQRVVELASTQYPVIYHTIDPGKDL